MRKRRQFPSYSSFSEWHDDGEIHSKGWSWSAERVTFTSKYSRLEAVTHFTTKLFTSTVYATIKTSRVLSATVSAGAASSTSHTALGSNTSYTWANLTPTPLFSFSTPTMPTTYSTLTTTVKSTHLITLTTTVPPAGATKSTAVLETPGATTSSTASFSTSFIGSTTAPVTPTTSLSSSSVDASAPSSLSTSFTGPTFPSSPHNHEPSVNQGSSQQSEGFIAQGPVSSRRAATVAGGIVGAFAGLAMIALLAFILLRRRRKRESDITEANEKRGPISPSAKKMIPWLWGLKSPRSKDSPSTSRGTPQIPPFSSFTHAPVVYNDDGLITISTDHWERPYSYETADMRSHHPSLLPLPLRVMNPDHSARPSTSRTGSNMSVGAANTSDSSPAARPEGLKKQKGAIGAALLAVKRTFSSDSIPRSRNQPHDPLHLASPSAGRAQPLQPPSRLGQTLTMPSAVIIAGGALPISSQSSFHDYSNTRNHTTYGNRNGMGDEHGGSLLMLPGRPISSSSSISANIVIHRPPDDPFITPSPEGSPYIHGKAVPYPQTLSPSSHPIIIAKRPAPMPLQVRVPSGQGQVQTASNTRASQILVVEDSAFLTDSSDSSGALGGADRGSMQETPLDMKRGNTTTDHHHHQPQNQSPRSFSFSPSPSISNRHPSQHQQLPQVQEQTHNLIQTDNTTSSPKAKGAIGPPPQQGWTTHRTESNGYLAPWSQHPPYPSPSPSPSLSTSPVPSRCPSRSPSRSISPLSSMTSLPHPNTTTATSTRVQQEEERRGSRSRRESSIQRTPSPFPYLVRPNNNDNNDNRNGIDRNGGSGSGGNGLLHPHEATHHSRRLSQRRRSSQRSSSSNSTEGPFGLATASWTGAVPDTTLLDTTPSIASSNVSTSTLTAYPAVKGASERGQQRMSGYTTFSNSDADTSSTAGRNRGRSRSRASSFVGSIGANEGEGENRNGSGRGHDDDYDDDDRRRKFRFRRKDENRRRREETPNWNVVPYEGT